MGSIEEKSKTKLHEIIQRQEDLENADVSEGDDRQHPPLPSSGPIGLKRFQGKTKDHKTLCLICKVYITDIDKHLTGTNSCAQLVKNLGYGSDQAEADGRLEAVVPHFGIAVTCAVLEGFEDWLKPEYVQLTQEWQDKASAAIQQIAEERIGGMIQSPAVILLVVGSRLVMINRDAIRRKLKGEKLPDDPDASGASEMGSPSTGVRGDSGNGEDFNGPGIS